MWSRGYHLTPDSSSEGILFDFRRGVEGRGLRRTINISNAAMTNPNDTAFS